MWFENRFSVNGSGRMRLTALERHSAAAKIDSRHVAAWMSRLAASAQSQKQPKTLKVALAIDPRRDHQEIRGADSFNARASLRSGHANHSTGSTRLGRVNQRTACLPSRGSAAAERELVLCLPNAVADVDQRSAA
ncbi:hypothetical protein L1887_56014 [Cichorium endivia]|nr:hypothetical protein L1887_56014 [Cichorium endivia]